MAATVLERQGGFGVAWPGLARRSGNDEARRGLARCSLAVEERFGKIGQD